MNVISCRRTKPSKEQDEDGQVMIIKQPKIARCIWQMVFQANFGLGLWHPILSVQIKNGFKIHKIENLCAQCLKITEKVSCNIASEASYVYIFEWTNAENCRIFVLG